MKDHNAMVQRIAWIGLSMGLAWTFGCGGGDGGSTGGVGSTCTTRSDCAEGLTCADGRCVRGQEAGASDGGMASDAGMDGDDGGGGDARADASDCPSGVLCGAMGACCAEGEECIEGSCLPACPSGVRCGAARDVCCGAEEVCITGSCLTPGGACTDSFDCGEVEFCEPTLGRCLPQFDPVHCELPPVTGAFEVTVEWSYAGDRVTECPTVYATPVVADLQGADGIPEVVVVGDCGSENGRLRLLSGRDGTLLWEVDEISVHPYTTPAIADLDGDGTPEILVHGGNGDFRILAFQADGTLLWVGRDGAGEAIRQPGFEGGAIAVADLDGDGSPEVIANALVFDHLGRLLWRQGNEGREGSNASYRAGLGLAADIDMDGRGEVVTGKHAWEDDGTPKWTARDAGGAELPDGYPAVAQFDDDPQPEVVLVARGNVYLLDGLDGRVQWGPIAIPGGSRGGPPTVADFDGDGRPEIGVAGGASYSVYDPDDDDGVLWSRPTIDQTSGATGSSVFDFEGDGVAEVVYADECNLWVYRGTDGEVLLQRFHGSGTVHEYPLVVDVDGDGNSELLVVESGTGGGSVTSRCRANYPGWSEPERGVYVYGDVRDQWVRTRRVWNQHTYHVTNVQPDGTVPSPERDNWTVEGLNNYRQNVQGEGVFNAPDLALLGLEVSLERCSEGELLLRARVTNRGALGVAAGVPVAFYEGRPDARGMLLGVVRTTEPLLPGQSTVVELAVPAPPEGSDLEAVAVVDDDGMGSGEVAECREDDPEATASIGAVSCPTLG